MQDVQESPAAGPTGTCPMEPVDASGLGEREEAPEAPYLSARGLELETYAGFVYRNVDLDVFKGRVTAVRGRNGSGKSALLLTLAGRMKPTGGTLSVGGLELPRERAKAEFDLHGLSARDGAVEEHLCWWGLGDVARVRVRDLTAEKLARLGIALAFVGDPDAAVVDDVEDQLTLSQSRGLMELLARAARERHAAVAVAVVERDLARMADSCAYLAKEGE